MVTTASRRERRVHLQTNPIIAQLLANYESDPNGTLALCFERFGRDRFENILAIYLHSHNAKVAMHYAIQRCLILVSNWNENSNVNVISSLEKAVAGAMDIATSTSGRGKL